MSKMTKVIAALGVVAGLGAAALPLGTYAKDATATVDIYATVDESLSIEASNKSVNIGPLFAGGGIATGSTTVTVSTTADEGYTLYIKDSDSTEALVKMSADGLTIDGSAQIAASDLKGTASGWGYKGGNKTEYTAITTSNVEIDSTDSEGTGTTEVTFGVRVADGQAEGTYKGGVIFTATIDL